MPNPSVGTNFSPRLQCLLAGSDADLLQQKALKPGREKRPISAPYSSWEKRRAVHRFVQDIPLTLRIVLEGRG